MSEKIVMLNLTRRWPFGLNKRNWPDTATTFLLVLFVMIFVDGWASETMRAWPDIWRAPFYFVTEFGLSAWLLIPTLIVTILSFIGLGLARKGMHRRALLELAQVSGFAFIAIGLPGLFANLLKRLVGRARPLDFVDGGAFQFQSVLNDWSFQSFPSGHSTTAMATAIVVGFLAPRFFRLILLIALVTGVSRVVVAMHYPTDVFAGFVIGVIGAYAVRNFFAKRRWLFAMQPDQRVRFRGVPNLRRLWRCLFQRARA